MSGHSHYSTIKHKKAITDARRGQIFSKISRTISVAAREGGGDPETNPQLRLAIERAKEFNIPKENIKKAIQRGTGELKGVKLEKILYEAYGPGNIAIIIEGITDNKNRTKNEINQTLNQHNGKLADPGSVKWMFDRKGVITLPLTSGKKEKLELKAIEAGAEDLYWHTIADETGGVEKKFLDVYTKIEDLEKVKKELKNKRLEIESASLDWVAKNQIEVPEKDRVACQKLFEALDEHEVIQEIYSNLKV